MCQSEATCLLRTALSVRKYYKTQRKVCWTNTKRISPSFHRNVTCYLLDIALKLFTWNHRPITRSFMYPRTSLVQNTFYCTNTFWWHRLLSNKRIVHMKYTDYNTYMATIGTFFPLSMVVSIKYRIHLQNKTCINQLQFHCPSCNDL